MRLSALFAVFLAFLFAGCCSLPWGADALAVTPASSGSIAIILPDVLLLDSDLSQAYSAINGGQEIGDEMGALLLGTGVDPRTVPKAVRFTISENSGSMAYIFQDPPGISSAESALASSGAWERTEYGGHPVFRSASRHVSFVGGNIVAGDEAAVKAAINVKNGILRDVRENYALMGMMGRLDQSAPAIIASEMTPESRSSLSSLPGSLDYSGLSAIDSAGLELKRNSANISIRLFFSIGTSEGRASFKSAAYEASTRLASMAEEGGALKRLLNKIEVGEDSECVTLSVETTGAEFRAAKQEIDRAGP